MRYIAKKSEILQVGDARFKQNRFRKVVGYVSYAYGTLLQNPLPKRVTPDNQQDIIQEIETVVHDHLDDIVWFYEGGYLYNRCLRLVSIRPRSIKEINDFLARLADNERTVQLIFERLSELVDDKVYAEYIVQKERSHNPKGDRLIRQKLKEKGVDEDIIQKALSEEYDVHNAIRKQYEKKHDSMLARIQKKGSSNKKREFKAKMRSYLFSKGFSLVEIDEFFDTIDNI